MAWQIKGGDYSDWTSFEDARILSCDRNLQSNGGDTCTLRMANDFDAAAPFAHEDIIEIKHADGTLWFKGPAFRPESAASNQSETSTIEIRSMWYFFEKVTLTEEFKALGEVTYSPPDPPDIEILTKRKSRVTLNYDQDGTYLNTSDAFKRILDHVNATEGITITRGAWLSGIAFPLSEALDQKCSEAVLGGILRWHPDAIIYFNYETGGQLCFQLLSALTTHTLEASAAGRARNFNHAVCSDLIPDGVVITYESTAQVEETEYVTLEQDVAGADNGGATIFFTISIDGGKYTTLKQKIVTEDIPVTADIAGRDTWLKKWFKRKWPSMAEIPSADLLIYKIEQAPNPEDTETREDPWDRELVDGVIQPWMSGVECGRTVVKVRAKYKGTDLKFAKEFAPVGWREFSVEILGTDAVTQTYKTTDEIDMGERVVAGLAEAYYNALTTLQSMGSITLQDTECDPTLRPGKLLTIDGITDFGPAVIQGVRQDVQSGLTTVQFGPHSKGMSPVDFLEYQRAFIRKHRWSFADKDEGTDATKGAAKSGIKGPRRAPSPNMTTGANEHGQEWFRCRVSGADSISVEAGIIYQTEWNDNASAPKPSYVLKKFNVAATGGMTVSIGDKIYCQIFLAEGHYDPEGGFSEYEDIPLSWSGSFSGSSYSSTLSLEGTMTGSTALEVVAGGNFGEDEGGALETWGVAHIVASGTTTLIPGGTPSYGSSPCDCTPQPVAFSIDTYATGGFQVHVSSSLDISVSGTLSGPLEFTPEGTITGNISPSSLHMPKKYKLKISHWDVTTGTVVSDNSDPEGDDETAFWLLAEIVDDGEGGIAIKQRHVGAINMGSMTAVKIEEEAGPGP